MAFKNEHHREVVDSLETAKILKESIKIVDMLAKMDADDISHNDEDMSELEDLIIMAQKLTKNRLWKVK